MRHLHITYAVLLIVSALISGYSGTSEERVTELIDAAVAVQIDAALAANAEPSWSPDDAKVTSAGLSDFNDK